MEPWQLELGYVAARYWWALSSVALLSLAGHWRAWIRRRYLVEALDRFARVDSSRLTAHTERVTNTMLSKFLDAPPPTLNDLANDIDRSFSLKP